MRARNLFDAFGHELVSVLEMHPGGAALFYRTA